jgi:hypothetical protein
VPAITHTRSTLLVRDLLGALFCQWLTSLHLVLAVTLLGPLPARLTVDP